MPKHLRPAIVTGTANNAHVVWPGNLTDADEFKLHTRGSTDLAKSQGTNTNTNAASGHIGEHLESVVTQGSAIDITTGTELNITSLSLTAGDWDVYGVAKLIGVSGTTMTLWLASISTTSVTHNGNNTAQWIGASFTLGAQVFGFAVPTTRISIASTTTVYLVITAAFAGSTMKAFGRLSARRAPTQRLS